MNASPPPPGAEPIEAVYRFCPRCGTPNDRVGAIPFRCHQCRLASFFGPVAAVGALVTNDDGDLLLVRRARDPGKGCWGLPGGFVDRNETIEAALTREVMEETNLQITSAKLLMTSPNRYNYEGVIAPVIDLFFRCDVRARAAISLDQKEVDDHVWVRPTAEHLDNMAFASNRLAIEYWMSTVK